MWGFVVAVLVGAPVLGWALLADDAITPAMAIHATLMLTAWGVLLPAGAVVARYFKVTPRQNYPAELDNLFWWRWHRGLQYAGVAVASVGIVVILRETGGQFDTWHGRCGLTVMAVAWLQVLSPLLRGSRGGANDERADPADPATWRGDHYDMTTRRLLFEFWHKQAGWLLIGLAAVTILFGAVLIDAPAWLFGVIGLMQAGLVLAVLDSRLKRRWVDTYHAIWGPDPSHPGNCRVSARPSRRPRWRSRP